MKRFFCLLLILTVCVFPLRVHAVVSIPDATTMLLVTAGEEVRVVPCFALQEQEGGGATHYITSALALPETADGYYIAQDSVAISGAVPAAPIYFSENGFVVFAAETPIRSAGIPAMVQIGDTDLTELQAAVFTIPQTQQGALLHTPENAALQGATVTEVAALNDTMRLIGATSTVDLSAMGAPLVFEREEDYAVLGIVVFVEPEKGRLLALPMEDIFAEISANPSGGSGGADPGVDERDGGSSSRSISTNGLLVTLGVAAVAALLWRFKKKKNATVPAPSTPDVPAAAAEVMQESEGMQSPTLPTTPLVQEAVGHAGLILGVSGIFEGNSFPITDKIVVGRDPRRCHVVFPRTTQGVSGLHCEVRRVGDCLEVTDRGSTFGTFLQNGTKLEVNQAYSLRVGECFYLGSEKNTFKVG